MSFLSPVFQFELIRAGRNRWHWWLRNAYLLVLSFMLWSAFQSYQVQILLQDGAQLRAMKTAAALFYESLRICQLLAVILLAPVFAAVSMSEEKTRRTLEYLLASPLLDVEIVGSKLLIAVLRVWEIVLAGLPLCAFCFLFGGLSPGRIFADFAIAMAAAWAGCCLAMLAAVWSRRLVEAILIVLFAQAVWYAAPLAQSLVQLSGAGWNAIPAWLLECNAFIGLQRTEVAGFWEPWLAAKHSLLAMTGFGIVCAVSSWLSLRKSWDLAGNASRSILVRFFSAPIANSPFRRRSLSPTEDPMLWRELRQRRSSLLDRVSLALVGVFIGALLAINVLYWQDNRQRIADAATAAGPPPIIVMTAYMTSMLYLGMLALPYLAALGATAFSEERDTGAFDLLRVTDLTQAEVVHAKARRLCRAVGVLLSVHIVALAGS